MESSRWGTLLVRATARGLLNPAEGCPVTGRYLLKEAFILNELERTEAVDLGKALVYFHAGSAQLFTKGPGQHVETKIWELARSQGLLAYQRLGVLSSPWDKQWQDAAQKTERSLYETTHEIGDSGLSERGIVDMITKFEETRRRWGQA